MIFVVIFGYIFISFLLWVSGSILLPFVIVLGIDFFIYKLLIKRLLERHKAVAVILSVAIAVPTVFIGGVSLGMFKNFWIPKEQKTKYEKRIEERNELEEKGVISFNAEIRNEPKPDEKKHFSRTTSFSAGMTMNKSGNLIVKGINDGSFTYVLTDLIYYNEDEEPCGFVINATRGSDGKKFRWQIHRQKSYFHDNKDKIKFIKSNDFDASKEIIVGARSNSRGIENPLCVDAIKN